jgi:hypothetical protein
LFFHHGVVRIRHRWLIQTDVGLVRFKVPHRSPLRVLDRQLVGLADEIACRVFKVLLVIEKLRFDFLNSYYEQVSPIIRTFKGFIVKYMGDGIMAVFPNRADVPETLTGDAVMMTK